MATNVEKIYDLIDDVNTHIGKMQSTIEEISIEIDQLLKDSKVATDHFQALAPTRGYGVIRYIDNVIASANDLDDEFQSGQINDKLQRLIETVDQLDDYYHNVYLSTVEATKLRQAGKK